MRTIAYYENRKQILEGRTGRENSNIIRKLERKIRKLQAKSN